MRRGREAANQGCAVVTSYRCGHPNLNPQGKSGTHTELRLTVRQASDRWFIYQLSHGMRAAPGGVNSPAL